jgi:hypothetical protein
MNLYVDAEKLTKRPRKKQRAADDGLRPLFFKHLKHNCQWTPIETGMIIEGIPDSEYCFEHNQQGWLEFKATSGWKPTFRPHQVAWIDKRVRMGGRVWIATRRRLALKKIDDLYLTPGYLVKTLNAEGFNDSVLADTYCFTGGPRKWPWSIVRRCLCARSIFMKSSACV